MRRVVNSAVLAGLQQQLDDMPRFFYAGCAAARDGKSGAQPPGRSATQRKAWAAGWLAVREGYATQLDHTGARETEDAT